MNLDDLKTKYLNKQFLTYYAIVFFFLYVFFSLIRFLGQLPILLIITFFVTYYITDNYFNKENSGISSGTSTDRSSSMSTTMLNIGSLLSPINKKDISSGTNIESKEPEIIIGPSGTSNIPYISPQSNIISGSSQKKTPPLGYNSFS